MLFDYSKLDPKDCYKLMTSTITPRPIGWVSSQNAQGRVNAAPFSFFNAMAGDPPILILGIANRDGRPKDSYRNIVAVKQFVVNLVNEAVVEQMNITAIEFSEEVEELKEAKLHTIASTMVKPPRIAEAPVSFECELFKTVEISPVQSLVIGRILCVHIKDEFVLDADKCYIDTPKIGLVGRMHGAGWYARTTDLFKVDRIPVDEWQHLRLDP